MSRFLTTRWIRVSALFVSLVLAACIGVLSLAPPTEGPGFFLFSFEVSDKVQHFIAYLALTGPLGVTLGPRRTIHAIVIAVGYGICLELAQAFTTDDRQGSTLDALANAGGAALGAVIVRLARGT